MVTYRVPQNDRQTYQNVSNGIKTSFGPFVRCAAKKREKPRGNRGFLLRKLFACRYLFVPKFKRRARESNPQPAKPASDFGNR